MVRSMLLDKGLGHALSHDQSLSKKQLQNKLVPQMTKLFHVELVTLPMRRRPMRALASVCAEQQRQSKNISLFGDRSCDCGCELAEKLKVPLSSKSPFANILLRMVCPS